MTLPTIPAAVPTPPTVTPERMQCMEVWGGNSPVDRHFETPGLQLWLHSRPFEHAKKGGDVYYVSSCASGRITRLLLADVSGHGERVASLAGELRDLMRQNVNVISQTRFVREMNRQFTDQPGRDGFATAVVCTFFAPTRSLQFCNAGHPVPMLYRVEQQEWISPQQLVQVERPQGLADTPWGVVEGADYSQFQTKLDRGDMMLCVSDAFTEARRPDGNLLGSDGLRRLVQEIKFDDPSEIVPALVKRVSALHDRNLNDDDATALLFRADGSRVSMRNNLAAPFKLFSGVRDNTSMRSRF